MDGNVGRKLLSRKFLETAQEYHLQQYPGTSQREAGGSSVGVGCGIYRDSIGGWEYHV